MQKNEITYLLQQAEILCQRRNIRLTPQRKTVLALMAEANEAISAYTLLDKLKVLEINAKPPTVYRALDFLLEQGFIHKVESTNSYILCHYYNSDAHTSVLFICKNCHFVTEHATNIIEEQLQHLAKQNTFDIQHSIVEIHGYCKNCQGKTCV